MKSTSETTTTVAARNFQMALFLVSVYWVTPRAGLKTQLLFSSEEEEEKNVIWTNKLWAAVYLERNIKGAEKKSSQLNFPTKSLRLFRFNIAASCDSHVKGISELLLPVTHRRGEREPGTSVSRPHAPGECVLPQPAPQCQLHSLDLITNVSLKLILRASKQEIKNKTLCLRIYY